MAGPLIVLKFGGTSLGSSRRIRLAARRVAAWRQRGWRTLVVVSATGHTTDRIVRRLAGLSAEAALAAGPETDRALATGELLAAALVAAALQSIGTPARSLSGGAAGLLAGGPWGGGTLTGFNPEPLNWLLAGGVVPVVAGFQAATAAGDPITLGRGASDLSAVFLAARLGARECHIVTDVSGVFERDPRQHPDAARLERVSGADLHELCRSGAAVVQAEAARLALEEAVPLRVYRWDASRSGAPGTRVLPRSARAAVAP